MAAISLRLLKPRLLSNGVLFEIQNKTIIIITSCGKSRQTRHGWKHVDGQRTQWRGSQQIIGANSHTAGAIAHTSGQIYLNKLIWRLRYGRVDSLKCGRLELPVWRAPGFQHRQNDPAGASFWPDPNSYGAAAAPGQPIERLLEKLSTFYFVSGGC